MQRWTVVGRAVAGVVGVLAAVVVVAVVPAGPAWAHAKLTGTSPAANATVAEALVTVTLMFNEPVKQPLTSVVVTGADGVSYSEGAARSVDRNVLQAVRPLPVGAVRVAWRTVSGDGHTIHGEFAFTNTFATAAGPSPSPPAGPGVAPSPSAAAAAPAAAPAGRETPGPAMWWWLVAGVVVLGALGVGAWWWRRAANPT
jgi:methionine-rich copper-binding protein CopC